MTAKKNQQDILNAPSTCAAIGGNTFELIPSKSSRDPVVFLAERELNFDEVARVIEFIL